MMIKKRGGLRQVKSGAWELCVSLGFDKTTGKRIRKYKFVNGTKKYAKEELRKFYLENKLNNYRNIKLSRIIGNLYTKLNEFCLICTHKNCSNCNASDFVKYLIFDYEQKYSNRDD